MDLLSLPKTEGSMQTFTFHSWLIVEVFTDDGLAGVGNCALAPPGQQASDRPLLAAHPARRRRPGTSRFLWQHMYRKTMAFGRKGIGMAAISAVDIAIWDILGKSSRQPVYRLLGGKTKPRIPVYASRLYSVALGDLAAEALRYKEAGYQAMKLRFGWGPVDGATGMQRNLELVRTVRRDGRRRNRRNWRTPILGWTLDYAKRMLPLLEPISSSLAGGAGDPRRHPRLCRAEILRPNADRRRASTNSTCMAFASCSRPARSTTFSSIPIGSGASPKLARSPPWRKPTRFR